MCTARKISALLEKFQSRIFNFFFFSNCHKIILSKVSIVKQKLKCSLYIFQIRSNKVFIENC
jgi:hypothetical protein